MRMITAAHIRFQKHARRLFRGHSLVLKANFKAAGCEFFGKSPDALRLKALASIHVSWETQQQAVRCILRADFANARQIVLQTRAPDRFNTLCG